MKLNFITSRCQNWLWVKRKQVKLTVKNLVVIKCLRKQPCWTDWAHPKVCCEIRPLPKAVATWQDCMGLLVQSAGASWFGVWESTTQWTGFSSQATVPQMGMPLSACSPCKDQAAKRSHGRRQACCWPCALFLYMKAPCLSLLLLDWGVCVGGKPRRTPGSSPFTPPACHADPAGQVLACSGWRCPALGAGGARGTRGAQDARAAGRGGREEVRACPGALRKLPKMRKHRTLGGWGDSGGGSSKEELAARRCARSCPRDRARRVTRAPSPALASPGIGRCGRAFPRFDAPGRTFGLGEAAREERMWPFLLGPGLCTLAHPGRYAQALWPLRIKGKIW